MFLNFTKAVDYLVSNSCPRNEWQEAAMYNLVVGLLHDMGDEIKPKYSWSEAELNGMLTDAMDE